jgi:hypothetical protein
MSDIETPGGSPQSPEIPPPTGPVPGGDSASLPANFMGVLFSPGAAFQRIITRPAWAGALTIYVLAVAAAALAYSLNVDWEAMMRGQFEASLAWKLMSSVMSPDQLDQAEGAALQNILSTGRGGMALNTVFQGVIFSVIAVHFMAILFATLFYLMGSLSDLKLGRLYLDGLLALVIVMGFSIGGGIVQALLGMDPREFLPYQAGWNMLFLGGYLWILRKGVERQPVFRQFFATYTHAMAVPTVAALIAILVILLKGEPVTVGGDQILASNLGAILGFTGTGALATLLSAIELFRIWEYIIVAIGFKCATRLSFGASLSITFLPWGFVTMTRIAMAAVFGG